MDQACDEFVHAIYGAVLDPGQWKVAVARMAALADAPHAGLHDVDFAGGAVHREVLFGVEEAYNRRYMQEYASIANTSTRTAAEKPSLPLLPKKAPE